MDHIIELENTRLSPEQRAVGVRAHLQYVRDSLLPELNAARRTATAHYNQVKRYHKASLGYYPYASLPLGYSRGVADDGEPTLVPNDDFPLVQRLYAAAVAGLEHKRSLRDVVEASGLNLEEQHARRLLSHPAYAGQVLVAACKNPQLPSILVPGLHQGVVDLPTFERIQAHFFKRKRARTLAIS